MCLSTISLNTTKGRINVPCGKCSECLQKRRSEWTFRLLSELRSSDSAYFVTLTYAEENLPQDENLNPKHVQLFIKKLRKAQAKLKGKQLRYYLVGEYGEKFGRPHYHMILFNLKASILGKLSEYQDQETGEIKTQCQLEHTWNHGNIFVGDVNQASIHYCTKYMLQNQYTEKEVKPFARMSRRPYLGHTYITPEIKKYHKSNEHNLITYPDGIQAPLPKIYKQKMYGKIEQAVFTEEQLMEMVKKDQKLIQKYGLQEYIKRTKAVNKNNYNQMLKQSKSKVV